MRTTLNIDDELLAAAQKASGIKEKTKLINLGLEGIVRRQAALRLARAGGTMPDIKTAPRRRFPAAKE